MERLEDITEDEAKAVVDYVDQQGDARGRRIHSLGWWLTNRTDRDLAHIRHYARKPGADVCDLHGVTLAGGGCSSCMGDIKAGDTEEVRAHLAEVGGGHSRPDLVAILGAPEVPAVAPSGHRPYRNPTNHDVYDASLLDPWPQANDRGNVSRRQRESDDLFDRAMERALQREAAMEAGS